MAGMARSSSKMKVYHGTGDYALNGLLSSNPIKRARDYIDKSCFCTTLSFSIACLFAVRKSSLKALSIGRVNGVVIEYELSGKEGRDWQMAKDPCLQDEQEVAVFSVTLLKPLAVWQYNGKKMAG
jgi:hypothetical protein